jgi:hypothetical protein
MFYFINSSIVSVFKHEHKLIWFNSLLCFCGAVHNLICDLTKLNSPFEMCFSYFVTYVNASAEDDSCYTIHKKQ